MGSRNLISACLTGVMALAVFQTVSNASNVTNITPVCTITNHSTKNSVYIRLSSGNGTTLWSGTIARNSSYTPKLRSMVSNDWLRVQAGDNSKGPFFVEATHPVPKLTVDVSPSTAHTHWYVRFTIPSPPRK
jgi:hypothetical protein